MNLPPTKGDMALAALDAFLARVRAVVNPTIAQRADFRERLNKIESRLVKYLRDADNPPVDWASYPVARDWFLQRA